VPKVKDLIARSADVLAAEARGRGVASVAVIERTSGEPHTFWIPESEDEPAFLAYSITKTFTASLILKLCEERKLSLEDQLAKWFPRIAHAARISIRQILNHTAGIPDYGGITAYHSSVSSSPSKPWSFDRFAAETIDKGLLFEPGQGWAYSNPGYMLAKRIAEEVSGIPYRDLISKYIAEPLGLNKTFVPQSIEDLALLAPGISSMLSPDGSPRDVRTHYHPGWVSHGVVASTSSEIVRFLDGLFQGQLVSRHFLDQMMQLVLVPMSATASAPGRSSPLRPGKPGYRLGLMGDSASPWGLLVGHNGGGPSYSATAFHAFDLGGLSVCAMGAVEKDFSTEQVVAGVLDIFRENIMASASMFPSIFLDAKS